MNKAIRFIASLPFYAVSVLMWVYIAITVFKSAVLVFAGYLTAYQVGQVLGTWIACLIMAALSVGLWLLGRYVRTVSFKKARKPAAIDLP